MIQERAFRPGDRVVGRKVPYGEFTFGTIIDGGDRRLGDYSIERYLSVQWDGNQQPDHYVWPDQVALMPPPWQEKSPVGYVVCRERESGTFITEGIIQTRDEALSAARRDARRRYAEPVTVHAIIPVARVVAPEPIIPDVEVQVL